MARPVLRIVRGVRQRALAGDVAAEFKARLGMLCREYPGADVLLPAFSSEVDRETTPSERWDFTMVDLVQQGRVLSRMVHEASRVKVSVAVWADITGHLDRDSGVVLSTRDEIAARVGYPVNHVSAALAELVRWNVLLRYKSGRSVLWKMNANIATRLPAAAGEVARKSDGPVLVASNGELIDATS